MGVQPMLWIFCALLVYKVCEGGHYRNKPKYLKPGKGAHFYKLVKSAELLRKKIHDHLIQDEHSIKELRSALVRQAFHDCVGGCDGCVDITNQDNFRLDEAIAITAEWQASAEAGELSMADVNALAGAEAAQIAINNSPKASKIHVPFFPGRKDCPDRNNLPKRVFPKPFSPTAFEDLKRLFGLTTKEAVGLLGAHSIGETEIESSGYGHFPWTEQDEFNLDNEYYQQLLDIDDWELRLLSNEIRNSSQWEDLSCKECSHEGIMMLHPDMGLLKDFTVHGSFHVPNCQLTKCPERKSTAKFVKLFARKNDIFIKTFIKAFGKMITTLPDDFKPEPKPKPYKQKRNKNKKKKPAKKSKTPKRRQHRRRQNKHRRRPSFRRYFTKFL